MMDPVTDLQTRREHGDTSTEQTVVSVDREHRDGMCWLSETCERRTSSSISHDERIKTAIARSKARARCNAMARCNAKNLN